MRKRSGTSSRSQTGSKSATVRWMAAAMRLALASYANRDPPDHAASSTGWPIIAASATKW
jgi:hypothetical protein